MAPEKTLPDFRDYKDFLRHQIERNRAVRGYQAQMAKAAGCQSSFLSQALHGPVHLTPDHGAGLCQFWQLNEIETDIFLELIQSARAVSRKLAAISERRLAGLRKRHRELPERFPQSRSIRPEDQLLYYSAWQWTAIHVLCGVTEFRSVAALQERLGIPALVVRETLARLERMGIVKQTGEDEWEPQERDLHLPRESPMIVSHHHNWRLRALLNAQQRDADSLHYTALYAISKSDFDHIRRELLGFIEKSRKRAAASGEEEVYGLCCDWFRI